MLRGDDLDKFISEAVNGAEEELTTEVLMLLSASLVELLKDESQDPLLAQMGNSRELKNKVLQLQLKYRSKIHSDIDRSVYNALKASDDRLVKALQKGGRVKSGLDYSEHLAEVHRQISQGIKEIVERQNLNMSENAIRIYHQVVSESVTAYAHGLEPIEETLSKGVNKLLESGIKTIDYSSGVHSQLDVALRRNMKAQLSQALRYIAEMRFDEYDQDLVYVNSVPSPRPSHADWELQVFSRSGRDPKYPERSADMLDPITGIGGVNCRHYYVPYYGDFQLQEKYKPPYSPELGRELTPDEWYQATQKQRYYERQIRDAKRKCKASELAGDKNEIATQKIRIDMYQQKQRTHLQAKGLRRIPEREHAYGIGAQPRGDNTPNNTTHLYEQQLGRKVTKIQIDDAVSHPLKVTDVKIDDKGRKSQKYIGKYATVVINPDTGKKVTTYPTSSRRRRKYEAEQKSARNNE